MAETLLQQYPDGHELLRDKYQWIVKHPHTCANAHRGPKGSFSYSKATYFTQEINMQKELTACRLKFPAD